MSYKPGELSVKALCGITLIYFLVYFFMFTFLCSSTGRRLLNNDVYLLSAFTVIYFICTKLLYDTRFYSGFMPASVAVPSALIIMLISISISARVAKMMGLLLPLAAFLTGLFDFNSYVFALTSGIAASYVLRSAKRRIDMVKACAIVAVINVITASALLLYKDAPLSVYLPILLWAMANGIASGMLVLGITPLIEIVLNSATAFRLIELLDLNAPLLRQLASKTPGTFNHSLVVANLAESACQEIGGNPLLARVGAYYHDIGKIDQPNYFVENQANNGNKHDDLNPRLSATVIRSHVKLGVEKGRAAGLPKEVIDIIATHHGDSLIAYFYIQALKKEGSEVNKEDFCYPGTPPRTKEAAVIMLADVTEAAVRTLDKPSTSRLEKFINELIDKKLDANQLSQAEITFRDLETIKKVFVRVLTSFYHSRIDYPKLPGAADKQAIKPEPRPDPKPEPQPAIQPAIQPDSEQKTDDIEIYAQKVPGNE
jgi:putative nucleotidyltransferase with HDIG domain